jgi:hypothetical protein
MLSVPFWKRRSLRSLPASQEHPISVRKASISRCPRIGERRPAWMEHGADDLAISSPTSASHVLSTEPADVCSDPFSSGCSDEIKPPLIILPTAPPPGHPKIIAGEKSTITADVVATWTSTTPAPHAHLPDREGATSTRTFLLKSCTVEAISSDEEQNTDGDGYAPHPPPLSLPKLVEC